MIASLGWTAVALGLVACRSGEPSPARTVPVPDVPAAAAATGSPAPQPGRCFVGQLAANEKMAHVDPADFCADGKHYEGASYRLSRISLFGVDALPAEWLGKYVVVPAERKSGLLSKLRLAGPCPEGEPFPIQARGDWAPEEGSYLTTSQRLARADYLEAKGQPRLASLMSVRRPAPIRCRHKGCAPPPGPSAEVVVEVHNTLGAPLEELRIIFHYEGGPGKPMPHYDEVPARGLAPGDKVVVRRPAAIERPVRESETAWWHFESATLQGRAGDCDVLPSTYRR